MPIMDSGKPQINELSFVQTEFICYRKKLLWDRIICTLYISTIFFSSAHTHRLPTAGFYDNPNEIVHRAYDDVLLEIEEEKEKKETAPVYLWSSKYNKCIHSTGHTLYVV